jgi:LacI family transcriptional regulator
MAKAARNVGLRDVARVAGVSTATVSRAMNNPEAVSEELRARIASVVDHLGWVPHGAARALATRRTGTIGAVFPTLTHGDFARAIQALQHELSNAGYTLLLACSEYNPKQEYEQVRKLIERGVDAIILVGEAHHSDVSNLIQKNDIPYVNTFVYNPDTHGTCVGPDNRKALYRLTKYLIDLGHRNFGVVAQTAENNDRAQARLDGIRDALAEKSIAIQPRHFAQGFWGINEGRQLFRRILETKPWPTAVICGNAYLSVGAVLESQAMGIRIPEDMSIVGYDDIEMMSELPVPINLDLECDAEIIVRKSSGPAPAKT